jgi:hypothetical protein
MGSRVRVYDATGLASLDSYNSAVDAMKSLLIEVDRWLGIVIISS